MGLMRGSPAIEPPEKNSAGLYMNVRVTPAPSVSRMVTWKWSWLPLDQPVEPTVPSFWPRLTLAPTATARVCMWLLV